MEDKRVTALEWLENKLIINGSGATITFPELFEQAKAMEKEQIKDAHLIGLITSMEMEATKQAEQYYNETYGSI